MLLLPAAIEIDHCAESRRGRIDPATRSGTSCDGRPMRHKL
jgi:hypothetical protein